MKMKDGNITGEEQKIEREDKICSIPSLTLRIASHSFSPSGAYSKQ